MNTEIRLYQTTFSLVSAPPVQKVPNSSNSLPVGGGIPLLEFAINGFVKWPIGGQLGAVVAGMPQSQWLAAADIYGR